MSGHALPDFFVCSNGKSFFFEIKETKKTTSFPLSNISDHQIRDLWAHYKKGKGNSYLVIFFPSNTFILHILDLIFFLREEDRKSIPIDYFVKKGVEIKKYYDLKRILA